jgi:23S rRNA pseudouridine2605 synthase
VERLQKVLAARGVASRRKAEELILQGRVRVNGEPVTTLGVQVDPERDRIEVDGSLVRPERNRYILLNKPSGYITTASDERGRRTVLDLVDVPERVVPVGRLDRPTSGLLLLTNDGELAHRVTHPRFELEKEYEVLLDGHPPRVVLDELSRGVQVDGQRVVPTMVRPIRNEEAGTVLRVVIHEGRNRIVRRMMERVGYPVLKLSRTRVGPMQIQGVPLGEWRDLRPGELAQLIEAVGLNKLDERPAPPPRQQPPERRPGPRGRPGGAPPAGRRPARRKPDGDRQESGKPGGRKSGGRKPQFRDSDRRTGGVRQEHRRGRGRRTP